MLKLMIQHLRKQGIEETQLIVINFEFMEFRGIDAAALYRLVKEKNFPDSKVYLFIDEIQKVTDWQDAVNSFRVDFDCDIYITGSNAYLLSSEFSIYLAGRYVEIRMWPLSFKEFYGYQLKEYLSPTGGKGRKAYDADGESYELQELFEAYMKYGGMPGIADVGLDQDKVLSLLDGIYSTVVVREILERERRRGAAADYGCRTFTANYHVPC